MIFLSNSETIKIRYIDSPALEQNKKGGCIDLYNANEITLKKGEWGFIHLGVSMKLPDGYDALLLPRSSTFKRYGILLTNGTGYIDNIFNGQDDEWLACVLATRDITIPKGVRCFQFRLLEQQANITFEKTDNLNSNNRGSYGSTGV